MLTTENCKQVGPAVAALLHATGGSVLARPKAHPWHVIALDTYKDRPFWDIDLTLSASWGEMEYLEVVV